MWAVEVAGESNEGWLKWARERDRISRAEAGPPGNWDRNHFGENNVYVGPALMLREINRAVGNTEVFALARDWVQTQVGQSVDRATFTAFVNRHTGRDFTALIDRWLDSPTTPTF